MVKLGDINNIKGRLKRIRNRITLENQIHIDNILAQNIIESLRFGVAPVKGTTLLSTGRDQLMDELRNDLDSVARGASTLQILNGSYGTGKSFTLRMLQDFCFQQNFATSYVTLTRRECALYDLLAIYRFIIKGLRVNECQDRPALENVLARWAESVRKDIESDLELPWSFLKISESYKDALAIYFESYYANNNIVCERALAWLMGDMTQITEAKKLRLSTTINLANVLNMLGDLTCILRQIGYKGLVILLDEAEQVPSFYNQRYKTEACNNLILLANCYRDTPFSFFIYATTPHFLDFLRSSPERYDELKYQKIVTLQNLSITEYMALAITIKDIYAVAYQNSSRQIPERELRKYVSELLRLHAGLATPRFFVTHIIEVLDSYAENNTIDFDKLIKI